MTFFEKRRTKRNIQELNEKKFKNRAILLDFSVDKRDFLKAKAQTHRQLSVLPQSLQTNEKQGAEEKDGEEDGSADEDIEVSRKAPRKDKESRKEKNSKEAKEPKEESKERSKSEKKGKKDRDRSKSKGPEDLGKTVFVRSIPYDITQKDFERFFKKLAPISYAKVNIKTLITQRLICKIQLVINKLTESHNGTGFVKFENEEDAKKYIQISSELKDSNLSSSTLINLASKRFFETSIDKLYEMKKMTLN